MKYLNSPIIYIIIVIISLLVTTVTLSSRSFEEIDHKRVVIQDLHRLKSDILYANIALRNAAIAQSAQQAEVELAKMLVTRSSANKIYDNLAIADLTKSTRVVVQEIKADRPEYRDSQLKVVSLVRKNSQDKQELWNAMAYYQTLMERYVSRTDFLIKEISIETTKLLQKTKIKIILLALASSLITIFSVYRYAFKMTLNQ
jgi:hypothetical protein